MFQKKLNYFYLLFIGLACVFCGGAAWAQQKNTVGWTLSDWMTQKKQFRAMDHFLALNTSKDSFEIQIEGGSTTYDLTQNGVTEKHQIDKYSVSVFWSIFGLKYTLEKSDEDWKRQSAQFNLRIFGTSSRTTNLVGFYGVRKWEYNSPENELTQNFAGGNLTLYIFDFFGVDGEYKKHFKGEDKDDAAYESERVEYGAFFDISALRLFGKMYKETDVKTTSANVTTRDKREGSQIGVQISF